MSINLDETALREARAKLAARTMIGEDGKVRPVPGARTAVQEIRREIARLEQRLGVRGE